MSLLTFFWSTSKLSTVVDILKNKISRLAPSFTQKNHSPKNTNTPTEFQIKSNKQAKSEQPLYRENLRFFGTLCVVEILSVYTVNSDSIWTGKYRAGDGLLTVIFLKIND